MKNLLKKINAQNRPAANCGLGLVKKFAGRLAVSAAVLLTLAQATPASAAVITWGAPISISGNTDVSASGSALYAYSGGLASGTLALNGVTFSAGTGFANWGNVTFNSGFTTLNATAFTVNSAPFNGLSTTYSNLLVGAAYGGATAGTLTLEWLDGQRSLRGADLGE